MIKPARLFLLLLGLAWPTMMFAQVNYTFYKYPDTIPARYLVKGQDEYLKMMNSPSAANHKAATWKRYVEYVSYGKSKLFSSGTVFIGWSAMENYLNKIVQRLLPDSVKKDNIYIYLINNAQYNAFAIHDGSLFINIGLLANVSSEAGLAVIIAHELSHYLLKHEEKEYFKSLKSHRKRNREKIEMQFDVANYSRQTENEADSLAYILSSKAGYDLKYMLSDYYQMMNIEKGYELSQEKKIKNIHQEEIGKAKNDIERLLSTHPETRDRIDKLKRIIDSLKTSSAKSFLISNDTFHLLQSYARYESLEQLMEKNLFDDCIEKAYIYYLLEPDDNLYIYFLVEAIRRDMYLNKTLGKEAFLYKNYPAIITKQKNVHNSLRLIVRDSTMYDNIKAAELKDPGIWEFVTYEGALNYFLKMGEKKNLAEVFLSDALYKRAINKESTSDSLLNIYITNTKAQNIDYAKALLDDALVDSSFTRELVLVDKVDFLEDHFYGYHNRYVLSDEKSTQYRDCLNKHVANKFPQKNIMYLPDMETSDLNKCINYKKAIVSSLFCYMKDNSDSQKYTDAYYFTSDKSSEKKQELDLFILNPSLWGLFRDNKLKSLEYLSTESYNDKTKITKIFNLINPFFYYTAMLRFVIAYYTGSRQYQYMQVYFSYQPVSKESRGFLSSDITKYKLTPLNYANSVFYNFKANKKFREK